MGYLSVNAFHKQAFASATKHQLLAFLQVAAFTNHTAVLPVARVGEPAFVGFPGEGFRSLDWYFDVEALLSRWPCLKTAPYDTVDVALQLGLPPGVKAGPSGLVDKCGKRTRPLVGARHVCVDLAKAASAAETFAMFRDEKVMITNWSQKRVGLGDALSPLFADAFVRRGGCHDPRNGPPRAFPPLARRWLDRADAFIATMPAKFTCVHVRAEKLASAATGREKRDQFVQHDGLWTSPYMDTCLDAIVRLTRGRPVLLITDTDPAHGTPSNQGSSHFREWRPAGEKYIRDRLPRAFSFCDKFAVGDPDCAIVEAAACRRADHVLRFGSGTFSEFVVGDPPGAPPSTQFLNCSHIRAAAAHVVGR